MTYEELARAITLVGQAGERITLAWAWEMDEYIPAGYPPWAIGVYDRTSDLVFEFYALTPLERGVPACDWAARFERKMGCECSVVHSGAPDDPVARIPAGRLPELLTLLAGAYPRWRLVRLEAGPGEAVRAIVGCAPHASPPSLPPGVAPGRGNVGPSVHYGPKEIACYDVATWEGARALLAA